MKEILHSEIIIEKKLRERAATDKAEHLIKSFIWDYVQPYYWGKYT